MSMDDSWSPCDQDGCSGACTGDGSSCLAHADSKERVAALERFSKGEGLDVRSVTISAGLLAEIFDAAPRDSDGRQKFSAARFDGATFEGQPAFSEATLADGVGFDKATFKGYARFGGARFEGDAQFCGVTFEGGAGFGGATFEGDARFRRAIFKGRAGFGGATFKGRAGFGGAAFKGYARFGEATFEGDAEFDLVAFERNARFDGAAFKSYARFSDAAFDGGVRFSGARFDGDAGFGGAMFEGDGAWFNEVTFKSHPWFDGVTFGCDAGFEGARFEGGAGFGEVTFKDYARFDGVTFDGSAGFREARFDRDARIDAANFDGVGQFGGATFGGGAQFSGATFGWHVWFGGATFEDDALFDGVTFKSDARFDEVTFKSGARFSDATFKSDADFRSAIFKGDVPLLGPVTVKRKFNLDGAQFASLVRIDTDAGVLTCRRGQFAGGVRFDVRHALVHLDNSDLSVPSFLTGPTMASTSRAGSAEQPRLLSLQGANVAGLTLRNVDLTDCRFAGAHNLDKLRLEAGIVMELSPAVAGWERRQVIAEECAWRAARARPGQWHAPQWPGSGDRPEVLSPGVVAGLYRALRKGREDAKDEPGAADFYYGEMEMRRHDQEKGDTIQHRSRGRVSRLVLTIYWLVSGYGLRAWRSLTALALVVAGLAAAFYLVGFTSPTSYWKSLLFAFRSTVSLTDAQINLTAWGGLFQVVLRLTGPVLLALTLLALRGRVKR